MSRDKLLPVKQLESVVTAVYADADAADWTTLPPTEHTRAYVRWVEDPRVGGILTKFMSPEAARSWLKDGPMKEYANARRGLGRYARFGRQGGTSASDVAIEALGKGAAVLDGSSGVKPLHCTATDAAGGVAYITWGEAKNFRNLLWAALRVAVTDGVPAHIVVLEPPGLTTPSSEVKAQRVLTDRCGLHLHHLAEVLGEVSAGGVNDR